jgi:hypothetical protein
VITNLLSHTGWAVNMVRCALERKDESGDGLRHTYSVVIVVRKICVEQDRK